MTRCAIDNNAAYHRQQRFPADAGGATAPLLLPFGVTPSSATVAKLFRPGFRDMQGNMMGYGHIRGGGGINRHHHPQPQRQNRRNNRFRGTGRFDNRGVNQQRSNKEVRSSSSSFPFPFSYPYRISTRFVLGVVRRPSAMNASTFASWRLTKMADLTKLAFFTRSYSEIYFSVGKL